jgi:uracil phosphoribosyltransferase
MRAGEAMEEAVREVLIGAPIGKILIQSHGQKRPEVLLFLDTTRPTTRHSLIYLFIYFPFVVQLFYYKMPRKLSECKVIVMDPMLATGESLKMVSDPPSQPLNLSSFFVSRFPFVLSCFPFLSLIIISHLVRRRFG